MTRLGMIGVSEGNGHPFSFSAIVNGYDEDAFSRAGWPGILAYLQARDPEEIGLEGAQVTHVWTQEPAVTRALQESCLIEHAVDRPEDMAGEVDAVVIARDDPESHLPLALPFLEAGTPVFLDKPLTVKEDELRTFTPYLEEGLLMSCSGLRFARELDPLRDGSAGVGAVARVSTAVVNDWERYGIHMLDAVLSALPLEPREVRRPAPMTYIVECDGGVPFEIETRGPGEPVFHIEVEGSEGSFVADLRDNFTAFRRTLVSFLEMVETRAPTIPAQRTVTVIETLLAGI